MSRPLQAPWRMDYLRSIEHKDNGQCFLCEAGKELSRDEKRERFILWTSEHCVVLMNRFPYVNGHLLIAPTRHVADLGDLSDAEALDLHKQTVAAEAVLKKVMNPQGFNIGINLGRAAGAGVPGHLHRHIVPRWNGDTNYMTVVGEVRVLPQSLADLWAELSAAGGAADRVRVGVGVAADTHALRHAVLRQGLPPESARFDGDDEPTTIHLIARCGEAVVGCCTLLAREFEGEAAWQLRGMAVNPDLQRSGVGREMLKAVDELVRQSEQRLLWCNARSPAIAFYQRGGWTVKGQEFDIPTAGPHRRMTKRFKIDVV